MKEQDEELWLKKVRESLGGYSESPPEHCWERLEEELGSGFSPKQNLHPHKTWLAAAAIAFLLLGGASIYFLFTPTTDDIPKAATGKALAPDAIPDAPTPGTLLAKSNPLPGTGAGEIRRPQVIPEKYAVIEAGEDTTPDGEPQPEVIPEAGEETAAAESAPGKKPAVKPSSRDKLHLPEENGKGKKKKWSFGVSVNSSTSSDASNQKNTPMSTQKVDIGNASEDYTNIPTTSDVFFTNGIAYMSAGEPDWDHRQPISAGISFRKELAERTYIETGLTYTYLSSEVKGGSGEGSKIKQSFHYLGIPVRVNWEFMKKNQFALYLAGGGMAEKCIYGKTAGKKNTISELQFSVNGALGAQYTIHKNFGLFIEPGVSYFFDDGSDAVTIRSDRRFNFNLQAGIRFTY